MIDFGLLDVGVELTRPKRAGSISRQMGGATFVIFLAGMVGR